MKKILLCIAFIGVLFVNPTNANNDEEKSLIEESKIKNKDSYNEVYFNFLGNEKINVNKTYFCTYVTKKIRLRDVYFRGEYQYTVYNTFSYWKSCETGLPVN